MRPQALALSPDGQLLVTAGFTHELVVLRSGTGQILQRVPLPPDNAKSSPAGAVSAEFLEPDLKAQVSFTGLAFSPDGTRLYLANVNGDIKVFAIQPDLKVRPLRSLPLPPANTPRRSAEIPAGIAVSADGKRLYVALNMSNRLAELDAATGRVLRLWDVGVEPYDVVLVGDKLYVSNWGGRRPAADSLTGPAGRGTLVRVEPIHFVASEGSVSVVDLRQDCGNSAPSRNNADSAKHLATIPPLPSGEGRGEGDSKVSEHTNPIPASPNTELLTGLHACALAASPNGRYIIVANAGSDTH
jgi:DNA-binding beta-propeller fold protein YncE